MSIANGTTYYDYPLVQLTDRPTFADYNSAFSDIDAKLHGLITGAETDHQAITNLQTGLGQTDTLLASVKLTADGAKAKSDTNEENIGILTTGLSNTNRTVATKLDSVAIAEPYDPDAGTYNVGDIVVYNGQRYKCTTAVAVSEPFDADKWTGEDVQTVLDGINAGLSSLFTERTKLYDGTFSGGDDITLSDNINNYRVFSIVDANTDSEATQTINIRYGSTINFPTLTASIVDYNNTAGALVLADIALVPTDGTHYHCERSAQWNLDGNGVSYFSTDQSATFQIWGYR